jgi:hypothetical protein
MHSNAAVVLLLLLGKHQLFFVISKVLQSKLSLRVL